MKAIPLSYGTAMRAFVAGLCLVTANTETFAQSADELAIPVRKGSASSKPDNPRSSSAAADKPAGSSASRSGSSAISSKSTSGNSDSSTREVASAPRPSTSRSSSRASSESSAGTSAYDLSADLAVVRNLRKPGTAVSASTDDTPKAAQSGSSNPTASTNRASSSGSSSSTQSGTENERETEDRGEYETDIVDRDAPAGQGHYGQSAPRVELAAMQAPSLPSLVTQPQSSQQQTAQPAQPAPNLYLPQPKEEGGILSKIFRRNRSRGNAASAPPPAVSADYFNSDYATRGSVVLPPAIRGNGYNGSDLPIGGEDPYRLASLPLDFCPTDLVQLPVELCHYKNQLYLRQEAAASLCNMVSAAAREGLNIKVVSAYRDIGHQTRLYNRAVARGGPNQKMVARPGKSEHNLGTTVDVTNSEQHCLKRSFGDTPEGRWLAANAGRFGWKMTVMSGNGRRSHNDEPWHLRYLGSTINGSAPVSTIAQHQPQRNRRDVFGNIGRFLGLRN